MLVWNQRYYRGIPYITNITRGGGRGFKIFLKILQNITKKLIGKMYLNFEKKLRISCKIFTKIGENIANWDSKNQKFINLMLYYPICL